MSTVTGFSLTEKDLKVLSKVHPSLDRIVRHAATETEFPFMVFEGVRTMSRQKRLRKSGASRTLNSRHLSGHAVDLVPLINGKPVWDVAATMVIAAAMFKAADDLGFAGKMRWGGDWDEDGDYYDSRFYDGPHFELKSQFYPSDRPAVRTAEYLASRGNTTPPNQMRTAPSKYSGKHRTVFAESVQRALNDLGVKTTVDGYYGETTRTNVREAQDILGIPADERDGLWGPATGTAYRRWLKVKADTDRRQAEQQARLRAVQAEHAARLRAEQAAGVQVADTPAQPPVAPAPTPTPAEPAPTRAEDEGTGALGLLVLTAMVLAGCIIVYIGLTR